MLLHVDLSRETPIVLHSLLGVQKNIGENKFTGAKVEASPLKTSSSGLLRDFFFLRSYMSTNFSPDFIAEFIFIFLLHLYCIIYAVCNYQDDSNLCLI